LEGGVEGLEAGELSRKRVSRKKGKEEEARRTFAL
jgi:hypothetical protein